MSRFNNWRVWLIIIGVFSIMLRMPNLRPAIEQTPITLTPVVSPADYLTNVLDIIQEHALYSNQISDWSDFRKQVLTMIADAQTTADTYKAIRYVIQRMNDNHSQLWPPDQAVQFSDHTGIGIFGAYVPPVVKRLPDNFGYIQLPQVITETDFGAYVDTVYKGFKQIGQPPVCGWVVDLRATQGGNMFPMLAALGPLLGNGELGAFIDKNGVKSTWFHKNGAVGVGEAVAYQATPPELGVDYSIAPVAVLTSSLTASAGEAVVISFNGRKQTQRFGSTTAGLTSANKSYFLSDGAALLLAESREADRTGYIFVGRISPDVYIANDASSKDQVLDAATSWLAGQCQS